MCKRLFFLISIVVVLGLVGNAQAVLVGYWNFDDGTANDSSGNDHHGTLMYDATTVIDGNIPGLGAGNRALTLDGTEDYVLCGGDACDVDPCWADFYTDQMTLACWVKLPDGYTLDYEPAMTKDGVWKLYRNANGHGIALGSYCNGGDSYMTYNPETGNPMSVYLSDGEWHHTAAVFDGVAGTKKIYIDGYFASQEAVVSGGLAISTYAVAIGRRLQYTAVWKGLLDEVYMYDSAESEASIRALASNHQAYDPTPDDGTIDVDNALASVSWLAVGAVDCRVYRGTDFDLVNDACDVVDKGTVAGLSYSGAPMGALTLGETYYWRIDVNDGNAVIPAGFVWDFTVEIEPEITSQPSPFDGCKYVSTSKQISWQAGDGAIKSELYFSTNQQWVVDACDSIRTTIVAPDPCVASPALAADITYYWKVDSNAGTLYFPGDVWSFSTDTTSPEAGLVGYWPLDEKSGGSTVTWDISGNDHHGTLQQGDITSGVDIVSDPDKGNVLECDNPGGHSHNINSIVQCGGGNTGVDDDPCWAELQDQITLMAWTKVKAFHTTHYLITRGHLFQMTRNSGNDNLRTYLGALTDYYQYGYINLNDGKWHHVALTYDNSVNERKVYTDGKLQSTENPDGKLGSDDEGFVIGGRDNLSYDNAGWDGLIDEVKLYDVVVPCWKIARIAADCGTCVGDLDANSVVSLTDLNILVGDLTMAKIGTGEWKIYPGDDEWKNCSDMDNDDDIDLADLNRMVGNLTWEKLFFDNWFYPAGKYCP